MTNKHVGILGAVIVIFIVFIAIFAEYLAPYDPSLIVGASFQRPSADHLLGTNDIGQDIYSELLIGARYSLMVGFMAMCISSVIGITVGTLAGWYGGALDSVLMKIGSFVFMIPYLPLIIILSALLSGSIWTTAIVMGGYILA